MMSQGLSLGNRYAPDRWRRRGILLMPGRRQYFSARLRAGRVRCAPKKMAIPLSSGYGLDDRSKRNSHTLMFGTSTSGKGDRIGIFEGIIAGTVLYSVGLGVK